MNFNFSFYLASKRILMTTHLKMSQHVPDYKPGTWYNFITSNEVDKDKAGAEAISAIFLTVNEMTVTLVSWKPGPDKIQMKSYLLALLSKISASWHHKVVPKVPK